MGSRSWGSLFLVLTKCAGRGAAGWKQDKRHQHHNERTPVRSVIAMCHFNQSHKLNIIMAYVLVLLQITVWQINMNLHQGVQWNTCLSTCTLVHLTSMTVTNKHWMILYLAFQLNPGALLLGFQFLLLVLLNALQEAVSALWVLNVLDTHINSLSQDLAPKSKTIRHLNDKQRCTFTRFIHEWHVSILTIW